MQKNSPMNFQLHSDLQRDGIIVGQFALSLVLLINDRTYPWFVLVPQRPNLRDLIDLSETDYATFSDESRRFSIAIMQSFAGEKLNVAALGNVTPQLHVHHVVRYATDGAWPAPIWGRHPLQPYSRAELQSTIARLTATPIAGFGLAPALE